MPPPRDRSRKNFPPQVGIPGTEPSPDEQDVGFEKREAVKRYLDDVWKHDKRCPICGNDDWLIDNVANIAVRPTTYLDLLERAYPLAPVLCRVCGYTFFINEKWTTQ
jgi:predicted nucleic-acid-binding Zn-ribbon protein